MTLKDLEQTITYLVEECVRIIDKHISERNLTADYVCIFSQSNEEYTELLSLAKQLGKIAQDTPTGPVYAFIHPPTTPAGKPNLLKIRKPDSTRPQRGDVDFNTDYVSFKNKYLDNKLFTLIQRKDFEMLELRDDTFDVLVYFSSTPLSKRLGVK